MKNLEAIRARKQGLVQRIDLQRGQLSDQVHALSPLFSAADRGLGLLRSVRDNIAWLAPALGLALVLMFRRRRPRNQRNLPSSKADSRLRWLRGGLVAWRTGLWAYPLIRKYLQTR